MTLCYHNIYFHRIYFTLTEQFGKHSLYLAEANKWRVSGAICRQRWREESGQICRLENAGSNGEDAGSNGEHASRNGEDAGSNGEDTGSNCEDAGSNGEDAGSNDDSPSAH